MGAIGSKPPSDSLKKSARKSKNSLRAKSSLRNAGDGCKRASSRPKGANTNATALGSNLVKQPSIQNGAAQHKKSKRTTSQPNLKKEASSLGRRNNSSAAKAKLKENSINNNKAEDGRAEVELSKKEATVVVSDIPTAKSQTTISPRTRKPRKTPTQTFDKPHTDRLAVSDHGDDVPVPVTPSASKVTESLPTVSPLIDLAVSEKQAASKGKITAKINSTPKSKTSRMSDDNNSLRTSAIKPPAPPNNKSVGTATLVTPDINRVNEKSSSPPKACLRPNRLSDCQERAKNGTTTIASTTAIRPMTGTVRPKTSESQRLRTNSLTRSRIGSTRSSSSHPFAKPRLSGDLQKRPSTSLTRPKFSGGGSLHSYSNRSIDSAANARSSGSPDSTRPATLIEYTFYVNDNEVNQRPFSDRRIEAIGRVSQCCIRLHLPPPGHQPVFYKGIRVLPVTVSARTMVDLKRCLARLEMQYPHFNAKAFCPPDMF